MSILDAIPKGWRLYKVDASVPSQINLWLGRDKNGMRHWHDLPEQSKAAVDIYVTATCSTLEAALEVAIAKAKLAHSLPLIEAGA